MMPSDSPRAPDDPSNFPDQDGPPITVLMPVRDGEATLREALGDLIAGLGPGDELLAVDDGSRDSTPAILRQWAREEPRLIVLRTTGVGLVGALNLGLREASNAWVARADADDRYPPDRLRLQRAAVADGVVLVSGDYRVAHSGRIISELPCALTHPFVAASLIHPQRIPHPGVLFDRDAVLSVGGYRPEDFPTEDLALWVRLAQVGHLVGVPSLTVDWTLHRGSITHQNQVQQRRQTADLVTLVRFLPCVASIGPADVGRELAAYDSTRLAAQRRVLLARDLRALSRLGVAEAAYRKVRKSVLSDPWASGKAAYGISSEWRRRRGVRNLASRSLSSRG